MPLAPVVGTDGATYESFGAYIASMIYATLCLHCEQLLTRVMHCTNGCRQLQVGSHLVIDIAVIVKRRVVHDCCDCSPVAPVGCMRERLVPQKKKKK